jgi:hypothetical protein
VINLFLKKALATSGEWLDEEIGSKVGLMDEL